MGAEEPLTEALELSQRIGALARSASVLYWLGDAAGLRSEYDLASAHFAEAENLYERLGDADSRAWMRSCRASMASS